MRQTGIILILQNDEGWQQQPLPWEQFVVEYVQCHWRLLTMDCGKESLILQIHTYKQLGKVYCYRIEQ